MGTRPEIIKMSPVIRGCVSRGLDFSIIHTGQHYSYNMDGVFFEQLGLPEPDYNLGIGSGPHGEMTGRIMIGLERVLSKDSPDVVLVEGDTNSVLAGALVAVKMHIGVGHVEAGLRSYDRRMPEEHNRVLVDHCSDYLFAPTEESRGILLSEGIPEGRVFVTGNTIVDAVNRNASLAEEKKSIVESLGLRARGYILATVHRQENVDDARRFSGILRGLGAVSETHGLQVVYPIHPRARERVREFKMATDPVRLVEPLDYLGFLQAMKSARLVLTDSGGVQEEACILGVPCVTLRENTERPETLAVGSNVLAGTEPERILEAARLMMGKSPGWRQPFGDGRAAERILDIITDQGLWPSTQNRRFL